MQKPQLSRKLRSITAVYDFNNTTEEALRPSRWEFLEANCDSTPFNYQDGIFLNGFNGLLLYRCSLQQWDAGYTGEVSESLSLNGGFHSVHQDLAPIYGIMPALDQQFPVCLKSRCRYHLCMEPMWQVLFAAAGNGLLYCPEATIYGVKVAHNGIRGIWMDLRWNPILLLLLKSRRQSCPKIIK